MWLWATRGSSSAWTFLVQRMLVLRRHGLQMDTPLECLCTATLGSLPWDIASFCGMRDHGSPHRMVILGGRNEQTIPTEHLGRGY